MSHIIRHTRSGAPTKTRAPRSALGGRRDEFAPKPAIRMQIDPDGRIVFDGDGSTDAVNGVVSAIQTYLLSRQKLKLAEYSVRGLFVAAVTMLLWVAPIGPPISIVLACTFLVMAIGYAGCNQFAITLSALGGRIRALGQSMSRRPLKVASDSISTPLVEADTVGGSDEEQCGLVITPTSSLAAPTIDNISAVIS
jgi:hypothetical protein